MGSDCRLHKRVKRLHTFANTRWSTLEIDVIGLIQPTHSCFSKLHKRFVSFEFNKFKMSQC